MLRLKRILVKGPGCYTVRSGIHGIHSAEARTCFLFSRLLLKVVEIDTDGVLKQYTMFYVLYFGLSERFLSKNQLKGKLKKVMC